MRRHRVIGTSPDAIAKAEAEVGFRFPSSFRSWLIEKNGLGIESVSIFPVFDKRDPRKTSDSIVRENAVAKSYWSDVFAKGGHSFEDLLAFGEFGTGDYYCFDYSAPTEPGEFMVVHVSHETGERSPRARTFCEFAEKVVAGEFDDD